MTENNVTDIETKKALTDEEIDKITYNKQEESIKAVNRIVRGINDVWEKDYEFKDIDLKFTIALRAPNAIESGRIQAKREQYLSGTGTFVGDQVYGAFQGLATIREVGVKVPIELQSDEDIYNLAILYKINEDFTAWLNSFRY